MARILVTGGTGTLGRLVVPLLHVADGKVRVLSRKPRETADGVEFVTGDLTTGDGVEAAVAGVEIIVNCSPAGPPGRSDPARTWPRIGPRAGAPGRSSC